jgi:hypothetical protein
MTLKSPALVSAFAAVAALVFGQGQPAQTRPSGKSQAPSAVDLTGYWVSIVDSDWRWRMLIPAKGDYASIPINLAGKKLADTWDPAKDEAAGEQCRSYGAPAIMQVPGRLRVSWQDDNTLKIETDAGRQTRLFHFGNWKSPGGPLNWQGDSVARWEVAGPPRNAVAGTDSPAESRFGAVKVVTTHIRPGYLRKNGVPYSAKAELTEYWNVNQEPDGTTWIVLTSMLHDPEYLQEDYITAPHFKKEQDGAKWDPQPCSAKW